MKTSKNRLAKILGIILAFLLLLALNLWLINQGFGRLYEADFIQNTWLGSYLVAHGENPYDAMAWQAAKDVSLPRSEVFPRFIYPLWIAILLLPFGLMPPLTALAVWASINIMLLCASLCLLYRTTGRRVQLLEIVVLMTLALIFPPVFHGLLEGQYIFLLLFLLIAAAALMQHRSSLLNGIPLAVALLKPHLTWLLIAALLWWALSRRRWQDVIGFAVASAVLWLGPLALFPNWLREWMGAAQWQGGRLVEITPSLWGLSYQFVPVVALPLALTVSGAMLLVAVVWWLRHAPQAAPFEVAPLAAVTLITAFYGMLDDQVLLLFPFWICWQRALSVGRRFLLIAWILPLPLCLVTLLALNPKWNQVYAIAQPITLIVIYVCLCLGHSRQSPSS